MKQTNEDNEEIFNQVIEVLKAISSSIEEEKERCKTSAGRHAIDFLKGVKGADLFAHQCLSEERAYASAANMVRNGASSIRAILSHLKT